MVDERLILNASIVNIIKGRDIEENVQNAVEVLRRNFALADETLFHMRTRQNSELLRDRLEYEDLSEVGNYKMRRYDGWRKRVIAFEKPDVAVRLCFYKIKTRDKTAASALLDTVKRNQDLSQEAIQELILRNVLTGEHPHEIILGREARTLENYNLDRVDVVQAVPLNILGLQFGYAKRSRTVYVNSHN